MEVSEVGGGRGWHAGGCIASAAGEKPLDYLTFTSAADCSVHNFQWEILGGWELLLGARRNRGLVASTHLCICILKKRMQNSWPLYSPAGALCSCGVPVCGSWL